MARQRRPADLTRAAITSATEPATVQTAQTGRPVGRRYALHAVVAGAVAAIGATLVGLSHPDKASAATLHDTDSSGANTGIIWGTNTGAGAGVEGENTGTGVGVYGTTSDSGSAAIHGAHTGGNTGVRGTTKSSTGNAQVGGVVGVNSGSDPGIVGVNTGGGDGIDATSNGPFAVYGSCSGFLGAGVYGECYNGSGASGVYGASGTGYGVQGTAVTGAGVFGISVGGSSGGYGVWGSAGNGASSIGVYGNAPGGGIGVRGDSNSSSSNSPGVWGQNSGGGPAIVGYATGSGFGFSAVTTTGTGCFGGASGAGTGVYAYSGAGTALAAQAAGTGAYAGYFVGSVFVTGALTVLGAKSAAVKGADGSLRRLYSLESPESWFEDFGSGQLNGGTATIQLEPGFAGVVKTDQYHVYLTPRGAPKGPLYIDDAGSSSFTVHDAGGASNIAFDYRIVAKRKDIAGARLEHVPDVTVPSAPTFPTPAETPPAPAPVSPQRQGP